MSLLKVQEGVCSRGVLLVGGESGDTKGTESLCYISLVSLILLEVGFQMVFAVGCNWREGGGGGRKEGWKEGMGVCTKETRCIFS